LFLPQDLTLLNWMSMLFKTALRHFSCKVPCLCSSTPSLRLSPHPPPRSKHPPFFPLLEPPTTKVLFTAARNHPSFCVPHPLFPPPFELPSFFGSCIPLSRDDLLNRDWLTYRFWIGPGDLLCPPQWPGKNTVLGLSACPAPPFFPPVARLEKNRPPAPFSACRSYLLFTSWYVPAEAEFFSLIGRLRVPASTPPFYAGFPSELKGLAFGLSFFLPGPEDLPLIALLWDTLGLLHHCPQVFPPGSFGYFQVPLLSLDFCLSSPTFKYSISSAYWGVKEILDNLRALSLLPCSPSCFPWT